MEELPPIQLEEPIEMTPLESNVILTGGGAVSSVNGKTGAVVLDASDVGAASASALSSEATTRAQADNSIRASVTAEANARQTADNSLRTAINNEVTARTNADATLQNNITAESNARSQADNTLQTNITNETTARANADAALQTNINNEATARANADNNLQSQIDAITASSDVTDVVGTYAQLEAYDTSKLNDNDIVKVLQDENHNDETTYYRWHTSTSKFTLIGEEGPYYTKSEANTLLNAKVDKVTGKGLSTNDFTDALKNKLDGIESGAEVNVQSDWSQTNTSADDYIKNKPTLATVATSGEYSDLLNTPTPYSLPIASTTDLGGVKVGANLSIDANGVLSASGGGSTTLYSTIGTNTDGAMTQKATSEMVYQGSTTNRVAIGGATTYNNNNNVEIAIGSGASANNDRTIAIGKNSSAGVSSSSETGGEIAIGSSAQASNLSVAIGAGSYAGQFNVALGRNANAGGNIAGTVALGISSRPTRSGEVHVGTTNTDYGRNSTNYRIIGGVYDGTDDHDAVTVGQLNGKLSVANLLAGSNITLTTAGSGANQTVTVNASGVEFATTAEVLEILNEEESE